jgi:dTDP-glucose pyrophosphorylase
MKNETAWKKTLLPSGASIQEAIANLDASGLQIALVEGPDGKLAGTLTDGDIRRGILRGLGLTSSIQDIMQCEPLVVPPHMSRDKVLALMGSSKIHQLPVVDDSRAIIGLHIWDDFLAVQSRRNVMVVLAGGKGTRLRPHTENCPKPMLSVRGKPMLEHIIDRARREGFTRFVFAINYLGHQVEDHFGDGSKWQVDISYIREPSPLGTAGALGLLRPLPDAPVLVTNGDLVTDLRYAELLDFHIQHQADATMAVRLHEWQNPFGVVQTDGVDIMGFEEKPVWRCHINAGIYVLDPSVLSTVGENEYCDMPTLFNRLREKSRKTIVFHMHEPWLDVGRPNDLELARRDDGTPSKES